MFGYHVLRHRARANWLTLGGIRWGCRVPLVVNSGRVPSTQSNFPVYVDLVNLPASWWAQVKAAGADIRVTSSNGTTELPFEIVAIDTSAKTGELHFKSSSLAAGDIYYLYTGQPSASAYAENATYGTQNVWDSNFKLVLHGTGASATALDDATANNMDVSSAGGGPTYNAAGKMGQAVSFDGTGDNLVIPDNSILEPANFTLSCWIKTSSTTTSDGIIDKYTGSATGYAIYLSDTTGHPTIIIRTTGNVTATSAVAVNDNAWHLLTGKYDSANLQLLVDGGSKVSTAQTGTIAWDAHNFIIAGDNVSTLDIAASIDEIRLSATARTDDWITTEYNNQNAPTTFYTVGTIQYI